ncbi:LytR/AlgR family response regulator transcription factor [Anditalea andensis]|uniref:Response regulator n=1 Tax=Anditalea andensis TaxID=1048983 RepID=A0A074L685_9BACT|nr:LytTR family DNA-binding domain-containing protein [Anditalea andensis]KEO75348.1 hypothetical protein EL17_02065 [Anditalea andensis]
MIKVIIIDDESHAQDALEMILQQYFPHKFDVLAKCNGVDEGISQIIQHGPDLIFLDIQMPQKNGFSLFNQIKNVDFEVIFTTAYDSYAIQAINRNALGYLLKPIDPEDLIATIGRYEERLASGSVNKKLDLLINNLESHGMQVFSTDEGMEFVHHDDIVYCKADNNYTKIYFKDESQLLVSKLLKTVHERLPAKQFHRIHDSIVVNIKFIARYDKKNCFLILKNGEKLSVSIRKKAKLLNEFY